MRIFKICLFLLLPFSLAAQTTSINGTSLEWSGYIVEISRYQNLISGEKIFLARDTVDANGKFSLSFDVSEINQVWLSVNRFTAPLFVEPKKTYELGISPSREFVLIPSWRPGSFEYIFTNLDSSDINAEIIEFDQSYFDFFTQNARLIGNPALRKEVKDFESKHTFPEKDFLADYIQYSLAEMKQTVGFPKNELYSSYLKDEDLKLSNPSFFSFFNVFYSDYFNRYDVTFGGMSISNQFAGGLTYEGLDSLFLRDDFLQRADIRQWVILKSIKETIYLKTYSGKKLAEILLAIESNAQTKSIGTAAQKIRSDYERSTSANLQELFPPIKELELLPKETLVVVSENNSNEWKRESSLINMLLEEYGEYFQVVEITMGMDDQTEKNWATVSLTSPEAFLNDLDIYQLPWYGWMDSAGTLTKNINKPSEGLEERLYSIRAKAKEAQKIKVGQ
ncbi:hypothetical protein O3Q51_01050 [Cryomorphaceae bacterium 1068]|nr:hypothetical protein [Cryomorphaceae bacterium 1068]